MNLIFFKNKMPKHIEVTEESICKEFTKEEFDYCKGKYEKISPLLKQHCGHLDYEITSDGIMYITLNGIGYEFLYWKHEERVYPDNSISFGVFCNIYLREAERKKDGKNSGDLIYEYITNTPQDVIDFILSKASKL